MYKWINRLKKENMNFQSYCLLKSLIDGKPYSYGIIHIIILNQTVYVFSGEGETHAKM